MARRSVDEITEVPDGDRCEKAVPEALENVHEVRVTSNRTSSQDLDSQVDAFLAELSPELLMRWEWRGKGRIEGYKSG